MGIFIKSPCDSYKDVPVIFFQNKKKRKSKNFQTFFKFIEELRKVFLIIFLKIFPGFYSQIVHKISQSFFF